MTYQLADPVDTLPNIGPVYQKRLRRLEITTVGELLFHTPRSYDDYPLVPNLRALKVGQKVTVQGSVNFFRNQYTKNGKNVQIMAITNNSGSITAVWFNQPFLISSIRQDYTLSLSGTVDWFGRNLALISPEHEILYPNAELIHTARIVPNYAATARLSPKWLRRQINNALKSTEIPDNIPQDLKKRYGFVNLKEALEKIHFPASSRDVILGRERLAFDELLMLQFEHMERAKLWTQKKATFIIKTDKKPLQKFIRNLPFTLTSSQIRASGEILADMKKQTPMNRLLQGDVGSGKTVVAAIAAYMTKLNQGKTVIMAPTQILAQQHYQTFKELFKNTNVACALITSEGKKGDPEASDIIIGTHALLFGKLKIKNIALVVIDEQHRFGVKQRAKIGKQKGKTPHILTMTATPIPRSVALTYYGDLNLSTLTDMPLGRKPVTTWVVPRKKRKAAYEWIQNQISQEGTQVFVVCPLIEESEINAEAKSVKKEHEKLTAAMPDLKIGLLHGKMRGKEKDKTLGKFKKKKYDILVATPVVEVGIDVPNASLMVVEGADRFGLAQLHQIRGRVGRGERKSYCLLFSESNSSKSKTRLEVLRSTHSGFELSEMDLKMRGPGEVFGTRQHGLPELKFASWQDTRLIRETRKCALEILKNPKKYKKFHQYLAEKRIVKN